LAINANLVIVYFDYGIRSDLQPEIQLILVIFANKNLSSCTNYKKFMLQSDTEIVVIISRTST